MHPILLQLSSMLLFLTALAARASAQSVILGVLEDVPGAYAGEPNSRHVRVVFRKSGSNWEAFSSKCPDQDCLKTISSEYPEAMTWTIAFGGREIGHVAGRTQTDFKSYSDVGLQDLAANTYVPTVGKRSAEFGGFLGVPVYRPLVAVSQPFFRDPESWKVSPVPSDVADPVREQFRRLYPSLCRASKQDETKLKPFPYRDEDIRVAKSYASELGWRIARLHLAEAISCDDTEAGFGIEDPWFVVAPDGAARFLGSGMWLVDAGDYDNDGKSELLFSIDRYDQAGYELFYDDFKQRATFDFFYH